VLGEVRRHLIAPPVTPRREMRYRNPLAPCTARARRSGVVVGATSRISASGLAAHRLEIGIRAGGKVGEQQPRGAGGGRLAHEALEPKGMTGFHIRHDHHGNLERGTADLVQHARHRHS